MVEPNDQGPKPLKVSALVVSHDRVELLWRCIESLERSENREQIEILVVDNGSIDGSAQLESSFPKTRFMRLPRNFGLTKALNIGIRASSGEYVLFLHDDTEVFPDTARELAARLDADPDTGAVCPLLVTAQGTPAPQLGELPAPGRKPSGWKAAAILNEALPVEYARGAALMVRAFSLKQIRQLDERYGVFGADAELCFQIRRAGKKILVLPGVRAVHHESASDSTLRSADEKLGVAVFVGKHFGFAAGMRSRLSAMFGALGALRFGELKHLLAGQKIDGTQP